MKLWDSRSLLLLVLLFGALETESAQQMRIPPEKTREATVTNNGPSAPSIYDIWLAQDVKWIITDPERRAFNSLTRDEQRQNFVENFWSQRDPTPDTVRNEFKDFHYQRMLNARQNFSTSEVLGWDTAKGRIYVMYGAPNKVEKKTGPLALGLQSAILGSECDAGNTIPVSSYELWYYNQIRGIDHPVSIAFAELCKTGESVAVVSEKDADWLSKPPVPKYKLLCNGKVDPNDENYRLQSFVCGEVPPRVQFKDLEEVVVHHIRYNLLRYEVQLDFDPITDASDMLQLRIKIKNSDLACGRNDGSQRAPVRIFGRFTTMRGRVAHELEDTIDEPIADCFSGYKTYTQSVPLLFGRYRLNLALQDVNGDCVGTYEVNIDVPDMRQTRVSEEPSKEFDARRNSRRSSTGVWRLGLHSCVLNPGGSRNRSDVHQCLFHGARGTAI